MYVVTGLVVGFYVFYFHGFGLMNEEPPSYVTVVGSRVSKRTSGVSFP